MSQRNINAVNNNSSKITSDADPLSEIISKVREEPNRVWTSTELLNLYRKVGGNETNSSRLLNRIAENMEKEVKCYSSPGVASILFHQDNSFMNFK